MRRTSAALLIIFSLLTARSGSQESVSPQAYDVAEAYKIYSLLIPREPSYAFGKDRVMIRQEAVQGGMRRRRSQRGRHPHGTGRGSSSRTQVLSERTSISHVYPASTSVIASCYPHCRLRNRHFCFIPVSVICVALLFVTCGWSQCKPGEPILNLGEFHGCGALCVIIHYAVDARAHWKAPHHPGIEGSQQVGHGFDLCHAGIEPKIVVIRIKNHWHSGVDRSGHGIRRRCQDRAGLDPVATGVFPTIPDSRKRKQLPFIDLEAVGLLGFPCPHPLVKAVRRN